MPNKKITQHVDKSKIFEAKICPRLITFGGNYKLGTFGRVRSKLGTFGGAYISCTFSGQSGTEEGLTFWLKSWQCYSMEC